MEQEKVNSLEQEFQRVRKKYGLKSGANFFNWSGKSISKMASDEGVNLAWEYRIIYGKLSAIEHTAPETVRNYLGDTDDGRVKTMIGPRDKDIGLALITALQYFYHVRAITCVVFGLKELAHGSQIDALNKLSKKYWGRMIHKGQQ